MIPIQQLPTIIILSFLTSAESVQKDPLLDQGGQTIVNVGVVLIAVGLVIIVRMLSPRVEHAIIFAILLSFGLVGFFLIK